MSAWGLAVFVKIDGSLPRGRLQKNGLSFQRAMSLERTSSLIKGPHDAQDKREIRNTDGNARYDGLLTHQTAVAAALLALEVRIWEFQAFIAAYPLPAGAPRGDGHPVLVLPGLCRERRFNCCDTGAQGYAAHGWKQVRTTTSARR